MNLNFWSFSFYLPRSWITNVHHYTQSYEMLGTESKSLFLLGQYFTNCAISQPISWHGQVDCCCPLTLTCNCQDLRVCSGSPLRYASICLDFYGTQSLLTSRLSRPSLPWQPPTACSLSGCLAALSLRPSVLATQSQSHLNRAWSRAALSS